MEKAFITPRGDFGSAGYVNMHYFDRLPANIAETTIGENGDERILLAFSHTIGEKDLFNYNGADRVVPSVNPGTLLGAIEWFHNDGPWTPPENYRAIKFLLRYSQGSDEDGFSLTVNGYTGLGPVNSKFR